MAGYKMEHFRGMNYDKESFKKLKAVEVSGSESTQETPSNDPKEMSKEDVLYMLEIVPMFEFKAEALQVKYPIIDWEIYTKEKAKLLDEQIAQRLHDEEVKKAAARDKQEKDDMERAQLLQKWYDDKEENID
nr:hypothetical protein [Tanacetum cinerariifolium]